MSSIYEASLNDCPLMEARKRQEVGEDQVIAECHRNNQNPSEGYDSIILTRKEVDELYRLMSIVISVLDDLQTQYVIIKGSLLGATRSESILFNDNDIDIGIIDDGQDSLGRFHENLIQALDVSSARHRFVNGKEVTYHHARRSKEGCIRIHSSETSRAWVDIFVLKRYDSREQLMRLFDTEENAQTEDSSLYRVNYFLFESFPLYHYDDRNSIALWPNQHFSPSELFPLQHLKFGPLDVVAPRETVQTLQRFYGDDCFTHYSLVKIMSGHADHSKVDRMTAEKLPLLEEHYQPIEHSDMWSAKSRMSQQSLVDGFDCEPELEACSDEDGDEPPPRSSSPPIGMGMGMLRSKSLFVLGANSLHRSPSPSALSASLTIIYDADCMPREPGPSKWFGADLRQCTGSCSDAPEFEKTLRKAMEPHLQTARRNREMSRSPTTLQIDAPIASYVGVPYTSMREERRFLFDEHSYPIHEVLAQTLGIDDLSKLHEHPNQDMGQLLAPLLSRQHRRQFHSCFDNLVTSFCIPLLHSMAMEKRIFHNKSTKTPSKVTYRYQAFPCIRVVRPGEFSIAPHCDTAYGHSIGNLSFHIPLTPAFGTNALFTESYPGREDWHPLSTKSVGLGYLFDGARCLHFALENTTEATRVSLDFRIAMYREDLSHTSGVDGGLCGKSMLEDRFSMAGPGYYDEASIDIGVSSSFFSGSMVAQKYSRHLFDPDCRVGIPFTNEPAS